MFTHIVFLIDTDLPDSSDVQKTWLCNSICLTCLRLLHLYSAETDKRGVVNKSKQTHTSVKWGYKFFSSKLLRTRIESHKLYDVKLKYFEEFENELQKRFEKPISSVKTPCKPSDCLSKTFTEVLADFQWEKPDITSPVKGRKYRKNTSTHSNILILFTACPKNGVELKKFTGKQVPDEDVFLDSLLPPRLLQEFCHVNKLTLNWIDTSDSTSIASDNKDVKSARIISSAIAKTGGKVFPLGAVTQNGNPYFSHLSDLLKELVPGERNAGVKDNTADGGASIFPLSSMFASLFSPSPTYSFSKSGQHNGQQASSIYIGGRGIQVSLEPLTMTTDLDRCRKVCSESVDLSMVIREGDSEAASGLTPSLTNLQAYGIVPKHSVTINTMVKKCYICTENLQKCQGKKQMPKHGLFQSVVYALATRGIVMVLLCKDSGDLAVLEPFTAQTATISLLTKGSSLCMEKALMTQELDRVTSHVKSESCDDLVQRLLASRHIPKPRVECEEPSGRGFDSKLLDRWYLPGPGSNLKGLINKLNERIGELPFLSTDEVSVLKQLQKCYKQEGKPPGLRETPTMPAPAVPDLPKPEADKLELPYRGKASRASLSRIDMIINKSKEVVKERGQTEREDSGTHREKQGKDKPEIAAQVSDFTNEEELKDYLALTYGRVVSREITSVDSTVQTMVTVALHYLKQTTQNEVEAKCQSLLEDCLVLSGAKLREKYITAGDSASQEQKIAEYQAQVVLRLEILSNLVNKDQTIGEEEANEEVVGLLRTLSFIWEPGALSLFMQSSLTYSYIHTIPKTLANIYDELMQPLPDILANLVSPDDSSGDKSVLNTSLNSNDEFGPPSARTRSHGSVGPPSNQPLSNASMTQDTSLARAKPGRKLVHHPSLADFGSKRQIVIQKASKPKEARSAKRKRQDSGKQRRDGVSKALFDTTKRGTKLERRQSVAVMERTRKTPKKMTKSKLLLKSPARNWLSPRRKMVAETPSHKQVSQSMFQQTMLPDQAPVDLDTTDVVEESPEKSCEQSLKDTPTKGKRAKALLRRSFYSAGPLKRTRNLSHYFQLADRIAGRQRHLSNTAKDKPKKLLSFDADPKFKSPDKNSSYLLSQLVSSPSPAKTTPRKSTRTPSKLLADSPSFHTRSQSVSLRPNLMSPDSKVGSSLPRPPSLHLFSPVSRRQSPRVFVAESETKSHRDMSHITPVKSPAVGTVSFGLDSPSQNTRQKTTATPTRKSVRAALFAKSPATRKNQSPARARASPTVLVSRFLSPSKCQSGEKACRMSPRRILETQLSTGFSPAKASGKENIDRGLPFEKFGNNRSGVRNLNLNNMNSEEKCLTRPAEKSVICSPVGKGRSVPPNQTSAQRTPSPHRKRTTKTPDSFDKWHRRKPRSTQASPAPSKLLQTNIEIPESSKPINCDSLRDQTNVAVPCVKNVADMNLSRLQVLNSPGWRKRSLIPSPEKPVESPSKRRRTTRLETTLGSDRFQSFGSYRGSQGFDTTGSFNLSQASTGSSVDYFSVTNDEVFLSQDTDTESSAKTFSQEFDKIKSEKAVLNRKYSTSDSVRSVLSPSRKLLPRLISDDASCAERSESPTFGCTKPSVRTRNTSGCKDSVLMGIDNCNSVNSSPTSRRSPALRKFSPNVSAKSLMHLIQSPLLASPVAETKEGNSPSHYNVKRARPGDRSRRSLKLQN